MYSTFAQNKNQYENQRVNSYPEKQICYFLFRKCSIRRLKLEGLRQNAIIQNFSQNKNLNNKNVINKQTKDAKSN
jgi:hypothetical protein